MPYRVRDLADLADRLDSIARAVEADADRQREDSALQSYHRGRADMAASIAVLLRNLEILPAEEAA
jgi:hypothetical protein